MEEIILLATVLAPIIVALAELLKKMGIVSPRFIPVLVVFLGVGIAILAAPFTYLPVEMRAWAGGLAGLSAVGLYELTVLNTRRRGE